MIVFLSPRGGQVGVIGLREDIFLKKACIVFPLKFKAS